MLWRGAGKGGYRIGTVVDVTDLHVALEDAERLRAHFEAIFTNNDMPMATLDSSGGFLDVNAPMLSLLGTERGRSSAVTLVASFMRGS